MPRARNTTVGPKADALDAAAKARDRAERTAELTRLEVLNKLVEAIDAGMPIAEAARRAGYTREHVSKLYATAKRTEGEEPRRRTARDLMSTDPTERPRKATGKTARDLMAGGLPRKAAPTHDDPA